MFCQQHANSQVFINCVHYVIHAAACFEADNLLPCWVFEQQVAGGWACTAAAAAAAQQQQQQHQQRQQQQQQWSQGGQVCAARDGWVLE
jgi:hypothetical protein